MNKVDLTKAVAEQTGFTQKDVRKVLDTIQDVTFAALGRKEEVKLMDGVTLEVKEREARIARNPRTGESVKVEAKNAPKCKFGKPIKEAINA